MLKESKVVCDHKDLRSCGKCRHANPHEPEESDCISIGSCWQHLDNHKVKERYSNVRCRVFKEEKKV